MFVKLVNQALADREQIIEDCVLIRQRLSDTAALDEKAEKLRGELQMVTEQIRQLVERNAGVAIEQADYQKRYGALEARYQEVADRIKNAEDQILMRRSKGKEIAAFTASLKDAQRAITDFDRQLWGALIERVVLSPEGDAQFILRNGDRSSIHCSRQRQNQEIR